MPTSAAKDCPWSPWLCGLKLPVGSNLLEIPRHGYKNCLFFLALPDASPARLAPCLRTRGPSAGRTGRRTTLRCPCRSTSRTSSQSSEACCWKRSPRRSTRLRWRTREMLLAPLLHCPLGLGRGRAVWERPPPKCRAWAGEAACECYSDNV